MVKCNSIHFFPPLPKVHHALRVETKVVFVCYSQIASSRAWMRVRQARCLRHKITESTYSESPEMCVPEPWLACFLPHHLPEYLTHRRWVVNFGSHAILPTTWNPLSPRHLQKKAQSTEWGQHHPLWAELAPVSSLALETFGLCLIIHSTNVKLLQALSHGVQHRVDIQ